MHTPMHKAKTRRLRFRRFADFYPFYLSEHQNPISRRLHVIGTGLAIVMSLVALGNLDGQLALWVPVLGYGCAWIGHAFFEKNQPATFTHPLYSLMGDLRLFYEVVTGRQPF